MKKNLLTFVLFSLCVAAQAQMQISEVDAKRLKHRKVAKYLNSDELKTLQYFSEIQPSVSDSCDLSGFHFHRGLYIVNASVSDVWDVGVGASPVELWRGKMLALACIYEAGRGGLFYPDDEPHEPLELHQIYFINLRIMRMFNVAAALMVTKVDEGERVIEFTYIGGNTSVGRQTLRLVGLGDSETIIVHDTFYRSGSTLRDRRFYPRFHQIAITDLHKNLEMHAIE